MRAFLIAIAAVLAIFVPLGAWTYRQVVAAAGWDLETEPVVVAAALATRRIDLGACVAGQNKLYRGALISVDENVEL